MTTDLCAVMAFGRLDLLLFPPVLALVAGLTAFWIWMFVDCARRLSRGDIKQRWWILAIAVTHAFGALAYFLFGPRDAAQGVTR